MFNQTFNEIPDDRGAKKRECCMFSEFKSYYFNSIDTSVFASLNIRGFCAGINCLGHALEHWESHRVADHFQRQIHLFCHYYCGAHYWALSVNCQSATVYTSSHLMRRNCWVQPNMENSFDFMNSRTRAHGACRVDPIWIRMIVCRLSGMK